MSCGCLLHPDSTALSVIDIRQFPHAVTAYAYRLAIEGSTMNMSLYELYVWLAEIDFPSLSAIWTWLITVPWWLAILTMVFIVFTVRITWSMACYFLNWLFDWTFKAGERFDDWVRVAKIRTTAVVEFSRLVKQKLFR